MSDLPTTVDHEPQSQRPHERIALERLRSRLLDDAGPTALSRYEVEGTLGSGGNGIVYAGYDPKLQRAVAIKVLNGRGYVDPSGRERLLREARALAQLQHPHVVSVFDVGETDDRRGVYVVMERLAGPTLSEYTRADAGAWDEVVRTYLQAGRGLAAAHAAGLVHRDFKPSNAMFDEHGTVKVLDFGLVRPAEDSSGRSTDSVAPEHEQSGPTVDTTQDSERLTHSGMVVGTPRYMAPEQHRRRTATAASDQFAFCVALFEALFERPPFAGADIVELAAAKLTGVIAEVPAERAPTAVTAAVLRGLSARPDDRFPSMERLLRALQRSITPRRWTKTVVVASLGLASVVTAAVVSGRPDPCPDQDPLWNEGEHDTLRHAFAQSALPHHERVFERVDAAAAAWSDEWTDVRRRACEAFNLGSVDDVSFDHTQGCLQRRRARFRHLLQSLDAEHRARLAAAPSSLSALTRPSRCSDTEDAQRLEPRPGDPGLAATIDALRQRERALFDELNVGNGGEVRADVEQLVQDARTAGYVPFIAEAEALQARALADRGDGEAADALWRDAIAKAHATGHDLLVARNVAQILFNRGVYLEQLSEARDELPWAFAMVERAGDLPVPRGGLLTTVGHLQMRSGDPDAAERAFTDAHAAYAQAVPPHQAGMADADFGRALLARSRGEYDQALSLTEAAITRMEDAQGELSTSVAMFREEYGFALMMAGRVEEGQTEVGVALDVVRAVRGEHHPELIQMLHGMASVQRRTDPEAAALTAASGLALAIEIRGVDHEQTAWLHNIMALIEADRGNVEAALTQAASAVAIFGRIRGEQSAEVATALGARATILAGADRIEEARVSLERVAAIGDAVHRPDIAEHARGDLAALPDPSAVAAENEAEQPNRNPAGLP